MLFRTASGPSFYYLLSKKGVRVAVSSGRRIVAAASSSVPTRSLGAGQAARLAPGEGGQVATGRRVFDAKSLVVGSSIGEVIGRGRKGVKEATSAFATVCSLRVLVAVTAGRPRTSISPRPTQASCQR